MLSWGGKKSFFLGIICLGVGVRMGEESKGGRTESESYNYDTWEII